MTIDNNVISAIGLLLDIVGVTLIFFFGVSPTLYDQANGSLTIGMTDKEVATAKKYKLLSKLDFWLVFIGFVFQALGNTFIYQFFKDNTNVFSCFF